jgi:hypothetical protein
VSDTAATPERPGVLTIVLFAIYALLLVGVILLKFPFSYELSNGGRELNLIPFTGSFADHRLGVSEVIENVLIFVPLGLYLPMVTRWSLGGRVLTIAVTSVAPEAIQYAFAIARRNRSGHSVLHLPEGAQQVAIIRLRRRGGMCPRTAPAGLRARAAPRLPRSRARGPE